MFTAVSPGLGLQVLTSTTTLFLADKARPQAHPGALASFSVVMMLKTPLLFEIGPASHCDLDWTWV
jgi:hypothetical protein